MDKRKVTIGILSISLIGSMGFNAYNLYSIESLSLSAENSIAQLENDLKQTKDEIAAIQDEKNSIQTKYDALIIENDILKQDYASLLETSVLDNTSQINENNHISASSKANEIIPGGIGDWDSTVGPSEDEQAIRGGQGGTTAGNDYGNVFDRSSYIPDDIVFPDGTTSGTDEAHSGKGGTTTGNDYGNVLDR